MPRLRHEMLLRYAFIGLASLSACSDASERNRGTALPPMFSGGDGTMASPAPNGAAGSGASSAGNNESAGNLPLQPSGNTSTTPEPARLERVLVFSRTLGFRHDSIAAGIAAIQKLGMEQGFAVDQSEDPAQFNDATLADYDVVIWLSTTADVLDDGQQSAFQRYIEAGGGWVGVHAAADTEYDWPWYGQLLGNNAWFRIHPMIQTAQVDVEQADHPATAHLPARFALEDEWYNFRANPRSAVNVLLRLDETSYQPGDGAMGDHPIAWYHEFDGGRAFYTALGHRIELYTDPQYTQHLLGGIRWAAGL
jgi:type 1 glutamine amidotransferase